jgi:hypothetical protein
MDGVAGAGERASQSFMVIRAAKGRRRFAYWI